MKPYALCLIACGAISAAACSNVNTPLLFGQTQTVGITINGSTTTQGGELTLGYRDYDIAIIPTTVTQGSGAVTQLNATAGDGFSDALSVIGQFQVSAQGAGPQVTLGKFFATGLAAKTLADGFKAQLSK